MLIVLAVFALSQDAKVRELLQKGDALWADREKEGKGLAAVETYQKALALDESCVEAYWKLARTYFSLGSREKDDEKKAKLYREGIEFCKMGISVDANSIESHFWLGVMYGLFGEVKGIMQSLYLVDPMKQEMEWVLARNEKFEYAGAHRVLGRLYHKLPGIKGGDNKKAIRHFDRAIELSPEIPRSYLYLAEVLVDEGRKEEAKKALRKCLETPDHPVWGPESRDEKEKSRELLKKLEG